jgi:methylmalonyl-CoA/ethylmalonyl-CoA epimerase
MIRIRHIAISTEDPEKTAAWYKDVFGMNEVGRSPRGVYLSDGYLNLAVLRLPDEKNPEQAALGVHHFGFMVDDQEAVVKKLEDVGAKQLPQVAIAGQHFEMKFVGPDNVTIDVSHSGWPGTRRDGQESPA